MPPHDRQIAILGAGLSGLSLACALLDAGVRDPIVLVDRRADWRRDRTWGLWATRPMRFLELADHRWPAWRIIAGERSATARSLRHPYLHLRADAVYDRALARLAGARNVEVRAGEAVAAVDATLATPRVRTARGELTPSVVFDAMGANSPLTRSRASTPATPPPLDLAQRFLGWEVEVDRPVFDPGVATLMDFRAADENGLRFVYVLPFSATRALVEDTSVGGRAIAPELRRAALSAELRQRHGVAEWRVCYEERGNVPMTTRSYPVHHGPAVHAVGSAAGAIRPSSGYAFARTQAHVDRVARAFVAGRSLPRAVGSARLAVLDAIFLRALADSPGRFPAVFARLAGVPGDVFARFMTDASTPADEARIIAALPKRPFLAAALQSASAMRSAS
jgi:lycopene beta-cyclase